MTGADEAANELLVLPEHPSGVGVVVLAGSSGRIDAQRARVLAGEGAAALSVRWFGGPGQQPGPYDVPLELFSAALDRLSDHSDRLVVLGTSFGAEAALLVATSDPRVAACVAFAPSSVVWAGVDDTGRQTSHWSSGGEPLPFVPFVEDWVPDTDPPAFRGVYEASLAAARSRAATAAIPVERIAGDLLLVAGATTRSGQPSTSPSGSSLVGPPTASARRW